MNRKLGRKKAHRDHLLRNLLASLVLYETVETVAAKARETKRLFDRVVARNRENDLAAKRRLFGIFFDKNAALKVINELIPRYRNRQSGFVRSYHLPSRPGDNAPMMRLELVDKKVYMPAEAAPSSQAAAESAESEIAAKEGDIKAGAKSKKQ
ncbi:MAG: 50S ribosomal protein L17 [Patescibacteria group bacterium]